MEGKLDEINAEVSFGKADSAGKEMLKKMARNDPYYKRNRPRLCTFYAKGECARGDACPYRHELPIENELSHQNIKDRYHGTNDPVARKILSGFAAEQGLQPPEDVSVTSLFLTSIPDSASETSIRASLPRLPPAAIKSVVLVATSHCAFLNFVDREAAEEAARNVVASGGGAKLTVDGKDVKVQWGRSRPKKAVSPNPASGSSLSANIAA